MRNKEDEDFDDTDEKVVVKLGETSSNKSKLLDDKGRDPKMYEIRMSVPCIVG